MSKPYPRYYAVNDRPVKLVELEDGSVDALVLDLATGRLVADRSYFSKVSDVSKDVDSLTQASFDALVMEQRVAMSLLRQSLPLAWVATGDGEFPYRTEHNARTFTIRINDFPAEPLYTLMVDGIAVEDFEDWPKAWQK